VRLANANNVTSVVHSVHQVMAAHFATTRCILHLWVTKFFVGTVMIYLLGVLFVHRPISVLDVRMGSTCCQTLLVLAVQLLPRIVPYVIKI